MAELADLPAHRLHILLADALHQRLDLLLRRPPTPDQLRMHQVHVVLPAPVQAVPMLVREELHHRPDLLGHTAVAVQIRQGRQNARVQQRQNRPIERRPLAVRRKRAVRQVRGAQVGQDQAHQPHQLVQQHRIDVQRRSQLGGHVKGTVQQFGQRGGRSHLGDRRIWMGRSLAARVEGRTLGRVHRVDGAMHQGAQRQRHGIVDQHRLARQLLQQRLRRRPVAHEQQRLAQLRLLVEPVPLGGRRVRLRRQRRLVLLLHFGGRDDVQLAHKLLGAVQFGRPLGGQRRIGRTQPRVDVVQCDQSGVQQQRGDDVQRARRAAAVRKVAVLVAEHLADDGALGHVQAQQGDEHGVLLGARLERLEYDVEHAIRVQVEAADQRLDDLQRFGGGDGVAVLVQLSDQLRVALGLLAEQIEATLLVAVFSGGCKWISTIRACRLYALDVTYYNLVFTLMNLV